MGLKLGISVAVVAGGGNKVGLYVLGFEGEKISAVNLIVRRQLRDSFEFSS